MPGIKSVYMKGIAAGLLSLLVILVVSQCAPAPSRPPPTSTPAILATPTPVPPPPERPANIAITPYSARAAAAIIIKGSGFLPDEEVEIIMAVDSIFHGLGTEKADKIVADKNGAFEVTTGIPFGTQPGVYNIRASGKKGSVGNFSLSVIK